MAEIEKNNQEDIIEEEIRVEQEPEGIPENVEIEGEEAVEETSGIENFAANLADELDDNILESIGSDLIDEYQKDRESRKDWEDTYAKSLDLLGVKYNIRNQPFKGASGVTHPLLAEAVTQFQAQAYKELLPSDGPVNTHVVGLVTPDREQQADRVKEYMNYMITEEMEEYTTDMDQMLFYLPLAGSAFKKIYYDEVEERPVSKFIPASDLVVPYYASDLKDAERITHVMNMTENEIVKKMKLGLYREMPLLEPTQTQTATQKAIDKIEGVKPVASDMNYSVLEIHVDLDLEEYTGDKSEELNVKVPYIVTVVENTGQVLSIYRNYRVDDSRYKRIEYFVHYKFLPGLGFYGFGLTHMIGGMSRTATEALRQLLDAGTLSNLPAGFKSRGMRVRDDDQPIQPGEFRDVDAPGGNIKDQFQLLPFKEPSATLFQLLGFVVQAGQRFAAITDMALGNDSQNRAVGTTIALLERGSRVMSAIHKRCYYGMRQEFKILSKIFGESLPQEYPYDVYGGERTIKAADFDGKVDVIPTADPNVFSMSQRVTMAQAQLQIAQSNPQMHNLHEAYRRVYEALGTNQIETILKPAPQPPKPQDPAKENAEALKMQMLTAFATQDHDAHIAAHTAFMQTRMVQINPQVYALMQSHISEHLSLKATAEVGAMIQQDPNLQQLAETNPEAFEIIFDQMVAKRTAEMTQQLAQAEVSQSQNQQDPLVRLKQQEIDLKALDLQRKVEEAQMKEKAQDDRQEADLAFKLTQLDANQQAANDRLEVAKEKLDIAREKNVQKEKRQ